MAMGNLKPWHKLAIGFGAIVLLIILTVIMTRWYFNDQSDLWHQKYIELEGEQEKLDEKLATLYEHSVQYQDSAKYYRSLYREADSLEKLALDDLTAIKGKYDKINIRLGNFTANQHIELFSSYTDSTNHQ